MYIRRNSGKIYHNYEIVMKDWGIALIEQQSWLQEMGVGYRALVTGSEKQFRIRPIEFVRVKERITRQVLKEIFYAHVSWCGHILLDFLEFGEKEKDELFINIILCHHCHDIKNTNKTIETEILQITKKKFRWWFDIYQYIC